MSSANHHSILRVPAIWVVVILCAVPCRAEDLLYLYTGPPPGPDAEKLYSGFDEGRIVRLDLSTGAYDTVSGIAQRGGAVPTEFHGPFSALHRDGDGTTILYQNPQDSDPLARLFRLGTASQELELIFEGTPSVTDAFIEPDFLRIGEHEFLLISRLGGPSRRNLGVIDTSAGTFMIHEGVSTAANTLDVGGRTYLTISDDLTKVERVNWETEARTTLATIDPTPFAAGGYGPIIDFSLFQADQAMVQLGKTSGPNVSTSKRFLIDFSTGTATVDSTHFVFEASEKSDYIVRVFDPFITMRRSQGELINWKVDSSLTQPQHLGGSIDGIYSISDRGSYRNPSTIRSASSLQFYDEIIGISFAPDYASTTLITLRVDFPPLDPPIRRGAGDRIEYVGVSGVHLILDSPETLLFAIQQRFYRIDIATGDRELLATIPEFHVVGSPVFGPTVPLQGRSARPPAPVEYIDHLTNVVPFTPQTVAPDRNLDGDVNTGDLVRRQNEVEVLP